MVFVSFVIRSHLLTRIMQALPASCISPAIFVSCSYAGFAGILYQSCNFCVLLTGSLFRINHEQADIGPVDGKLCP